MNLHFITPTRSGFFMFVDVVGYGRTEQFLPIRLIRASHPGDIHDLIVAGHIGGVCDQFEVPQSVAFGLRSFAHPFKILSIGRKLILLYVYSAKIQSINGGTIL